MTWTSSPAALAAATWLPGICATLYWPDWSAATTVEASGSG